MAKCQFCSSEEDMPFTCTYCKGVFCADHRLPEAHDCRKMHLIKIPRSSPAVTSFLSSSSGKPRIHQVISKPEVLHLLVAWFVLGLCFSLRYIMNTPTIFPLMLIISLGTVGIGFILHELMHKFGAQKYGFWAEFRLWRWGLMMALIFSFASGGSFVFAAPGATYIIPRSYTYGWPTEISRRQNGLISLAGPLSNVALALVFLMISGFNGISGLVGVIGFQANLWLAAFNMIPFGGIDGRKVFSWNIPVWVVVAIPLWVTIAVQILNGQIITLSTS